MGSSSKRKSVKNKVERTFSRGLSKGVLFGVAGLLVFIIILGIVIFSDKGPEDNNAVYFRRTGVSYIDATEGKAQKVSDNLVYGGKLDQFDLKYLANSYSGLVNVSKDKERIFFPGDMKGFGRFALYYREINQEKAEPIQLVSNVSSYAVNEEGTLVVYISEGTLYTHNLKENKEVAKNISNFQISQDGNQIVYLDTAGNLYLKGSEKTTKLAKNISNLEYVNEDFETFYYTKDGKLYIKEKGKDARKLASNVNEVLKVYESGAVYYLKGSSTSVEAKDFVKNDSKEKSEMWDILKEQTVEISTYELFYFDGKKTQSVAKNVGYEDIRVAEERPVAFYSTCNLKDAGKVKLSELNTYVNATDVIVKVQEETKQFHVAVEKKITDIAEEDIVTTIVSDDGNAIYYLADAKTGENGENKTYGNLYKMDVSKSRAKQAKKYDENVYASNIDFVGGDGVFYYKNVKDVDYNLIGELYVNKKMASEDVKIDTTVCYPKADENSLFFITNWKYQESMGTFKQYNGKKTIELAKTAHGFYVTDEGTILFLSDYDVHTYSGNLYLYGKREAKKIDKDVVAIIQK